MSFSSFYLSLGQYVVYYPSMAKKTGSVKSAIFLSYLLGWIKTKGSLQSEIYKTSEEILDETGLSYKEQISARKTLKQLGILKERNARLQHRLYFSLQTDVLDALFSDMGISPNAKREDGEMTNGEMATIPNGSSYNTTSTSTTTTTTTKNSIRKSHDDIYTSPEFDNAWSFYPKRYGSNGRLPAYKHWSARVNEGVSAEDLLTATKNYQIMMTKSGSIGTVFVMQGQRFYGSSREYEQFININQGDMENDNPTGRLQSIDEICRNAAKNGKTLEIPFDDIPF